MKYLIRRISSNAFFVFNFNNLSPSRFPGSHLSKSGICQMAKLSQSTLSQIVIREARILDSWEVAKAHCSTYFSKYSFPIDLVLKVDCLLAIVWGFYVVPNGSRRTYIVAVNDSQDIKSHGSDWKFGLNKGYVVGTLTLDNVADYLPREGPLLQRRTEVAYLSDLLVREEYRRRGIAQKLIVEAEAHAKSWGCRSMALHCDINNIGAIELYRAHGFKSIKIPQGAKWPQPKTLQDIFMMKLLYTQKSTYF